MTVSSRQKSKTAFHIQTGSDIRENHFRIVQQHIFVCVSNKRLVCFHKDVDHMLVLTTFFSTSIEFIEVIRWPNTERQVTGMRDIPSKLYFLFSDIYFHSSIC